MNNVLRVRIKVNNQDAFIKQMWSLNISIWQMKYQNKMLCCNILDKDINVIKRYYHVDIINNYSINSLKKYFKRNIISVISLIFSIILFSFFSNIIVEVNIQSDNQKIVSDLQKELDKYHLSRLTLKKNYIEIEAIKEKIKAEFNNRLEWLEIENNGMKYTVKLELRKSKNVEINNDRCNVIADTDGIITNVSAQKGTVMVKNNQFVKEGDLLISGSIALNDQVKADVCSKGNVYAEKWYSVTIDIPLTYEEKEYTSKKKYNFLWEIDNRDWKVLKSRYQNYDESKKLLISLLGKKLYLVNEYEYKNVIKNYNDEELDKKIDDLVIDKLKLSLNDDEKILYKNILKKETNDSRIRVELFVTVEKLISKQVTY